jgi:hypothetical protein
MKVTLVIYATPFFRHSSGLLLARNRIVTYQDASDRRPAEGHVKTQDAARDRRELTMPGSPLYEQGVHVDQSLPGRLRR